MFLKFDYEDTSIKICLFDEWCMTSMYLEYQKWHVHTLGIVDLYFQQRWSVLQSSSGLFVVFLGKLVKNSWMGDEIRCSNAHMTSF